MQKESKKWMSKSKKGNNFSKIKWKNNNNGRNYENSFKNKLHLKGIIRSLTVLKYAGILH